MIFRIIIFLSIFFTSLNFSFADLVVFENPTMSDIIVNSYYWPSTAILWSNPTAKIFAWNQQNHQFCLQNWGSFVSATTGNINEFPKVAFSNTWYLYNWPNQNTILTITCDIIQPTTEYIIDSDPWINKSIFDEDTIRAIYLIEVIIIFFIFFMRFFSRILT